MSVDPMNPVMKRQGSFLVDLTETKELPGIKVCARKAFVSKETGRSLSGDFCFDGKRTRAPVIERDWGHIPGIMR
jgi:hypothetical protein